MSWDLPGPPEIENTNNTWTSWTYYNARSLLYWYQQWRERTLTITPLDSNIMQLELAGRLDDPPEIIPAWTDVTISDGEVEMFTNWLAFHLAADVEQDFDSNQRWIVTTTFPKRFVPSGGQTPTSLLITS